MIGENYKERTFSPRGMYIRNISDTPPKLENIRNSDIPPKWNDIRNIADMTELSEIVSEPLALRIRKMGRPPEKNKGLKWIIEEKQRWNR